MARGLDEKIMMLCWPFIFHVLAGAETKPINCHRVLVIRFFCYGLVSIKLDLVGRINTLARIHFAG